MPRLLHQCVMYVSSNRSQHMIIPLVCCLPEASLGINKQQGTTDKSYTLTQVQHQHLQPLSHLLLHSQLLPAQHSRSKPLALQLWLLSGPCRPPLRLPPHQHPRVPQHQLQAHCLKQILVRCRPWKRNPLLGKVSPHDSALLEC